MSTVISVENLGKKYLLSHQTQRQPYVALRDVIAEKTNAIGRRLLHPFSSSPRTPDPSREEFWALKDVSFEIKQGDRVGIIGRNGAGKSTLLKILSRIIEPTTGRVRIKGRVASLLEVGTGFHPELTGRENIFLNGAILGMMREEIKKKFDEIVDFAEIEKFLDTPVKRYSSGMYVRLAFAVAAHLEPEILLVDEVLAVGDAQFQKKCLGKMEDVSAREGRTVLFVSHNMSAIKQLCTKCLLLLNGRIDFAGPVKDVVSKYFENALDVTSEIDNSHFIGPFSSFIKIKSITIDDVFVQNHNISPRHEFKIEVSGECIHEISKLRISFAIYCNGLRVCTFHDTLEPEPLPVGEFISRITVSPYFLRPSVYHIAIGGDNGTAISASTEFFFGNEIASFTVLDEWDQYNDHCKEGMINIPHFGTRVTSG